MFVVRFNLKTRLHERIFWQRSVPAVLLELLHPMEMRLQQRFPQLRKLQASQRHQYRIVVDLPAVPGVPQYFEDRFRFVQRVRLIVHPPHRRSRMDKRPVRQRLVRRRAEPAVTDRKVPGELADHIHLLRAVALHQLVGPLRMPRIGCGVVQEKSHHLRPGPALWPQNLKCNVVELLVGVMVRRKEWLRARRAWRGEDLYGVLPCKVVGIRRIPERAPRIWRYQSLECRLPTGWRRRNVDRRHVVHIRIEKPHQVVERPVLHHHHNQMLDAIHPIARHLIASSPQPPARTTPPRTLYYHALYQASDNYPYRFRAEGCTACTVRHHAPLPRIAKFPAARAIIDGNAGPDTRA